MTYDNPTKKEQIARLRAAHTALVHDRRTLHDVAVLVSIYAATERLFEVSR